MRGMTRAEFGLLVMYPPVTLVGELADQAIAAVLVVDDCGMQAICWYNGRLVDEDATGALERWARCQVLADRLMVVLPEEELGQIWA